jgi:hypothetical protein
LNFLGLAGYKVGNLNLLVILTIFLYSEWVLFFLNFVGLTRCKVGNLNLLVIQTIFLHSD